MLPDSREELRENPIECDRQAPRHRHSLFLQDRLVNERQRKELKKAKASADRFEREVEKGEGDLTEPNNPLSTSIPKPGKVLAVMVCAIALVLLKRKTTPA